MLLETVICTLVSRSTAGNLDGAWSVKHCIVGTWLVSSLTPHLPSIYKVKNGSGCLLSRLKVETGIVCSPRGEVDRVSLHCSCSSEHNSILIFA